MRILVVEDDAPLASFVRKGLEAEHYAVDVAADGEQARLMALESDYDLMVLDLNLPRLDGISVLNSVRPKKPSLPVLVLTARSRIEDRVQSLDSGADDCLIKPFSFTELAARVRALLRRGPRTVETVLRVADLELDRVARRVERAGKPVELTSKEFALLEYLMRNSGRRVTRAMIVEHVWNLSFDTSTNIVDVYINYCGDPVNMLQLLPEGTVQTVIIGADLLGGQKPQVVVRGQVWQGCRLVPGGKWALMGTTMSPGFDRADYEGGDREQLIAQYPGAAQQIREYTR